AALLGLSLSLAAPLLAQAHDALIEVNPAPDAQLLEAPSEITLSFSNTLIGVGNVVQVLNAKGEDIVTSAVQISGSKLIQNLPSDAPAGWYLVNWRAVSSDGHPITGSQYYLVGDDPSLEKPGSAPVIEGDEANNGSEVAPEHHGTESPEEVKDSNTGQIILIGSLVVIGIGFGFGGYLLAARKKKN
ncbi:MAG: copper resistance CopC family protein, partial [Microbacteriaceae bacterium]